MDTMMKLNPAGMGPVTIRCRNRTNWIRIFILTLSFTVLGWLAFGLFCSIMENSLSFWKALVTPLALIFVSMDLVSTFIRVRNRNTDRP